MMVYYELYLIEPVRERAFDVWLANQGLSDEVLKVLSTRISIAGPYAVNA